MNILGQPTTVKVSGRETDQQFYVFQSEIPPGLGVPPHTHTREQEILTVLAGPIEVFFDGQWSTAHAGDCFYLPTHIPHGYRNAGPTPAQIQFTVSPAESFETFFSQLSQFPPITPDTPPDLPRLTTLLEQHGMTFAEG